MIATLFGRRFAHLRQAEIFARLRAEVKRLLARITTDVGAIAEMALAARDLREFEASWLSHLKPSIGFESACSVWSDHSGGVRDSLSLGYDEGQLRQRFPGYMSELSPEELAQFTAPAPVVDLDVVSAARRQRLVVYRELLSPHGITSFVTNVRSAPWGVFGFHLGRAGGTRFGERETRRPSQPWSRRTTPTCWRSTISRRAYRALVRSPTASCRAGCKRCATTCTALRSGSRAPNAIKRSIARKEGALAQQRTSSPKP